LLNIDSTLRYFALENTLINRRGSGTSYDLYEEPSGRFNLIPAEANRAFGGAEGGAGEADGGALEPLPAANDASRKLLSRLLAIPDLRSHYLAYVRDLAGKCLDWNNLGVVADRLHDVIADAVRMDARKTGTTAAFMDSLSVSGGLKSFADQKRAWLLGRLDALQSANQQ